MEFLLAMERETARMVLDSSLYILLGFSLAGLLAWLVPSSIIARHLRGKGLRPSVLGALFGAPLPLCSCSVVPTAVALRRAGADKSATMAFLISAPETGADSIALTYGLMGPLMAVFRPLSAILSGVIGGIVAAGFDWEVRREDSGLTVCSCVRKDSACASNCPPEEGHMEKTHGFRAAMHYAFGELLLEVSPWLIVGILTAGILSALLPSDFFERVLGSGLLSMVTMVALGIPMYVCASSSTPLAVTMIAKRLTPGAALVFLLAGPATNLGTLGVVARLLGRRMAVVYLLSIIAVSLLMGTLLNLFTANGFGGLTAAFSGGSEETSARWLFPTELAGAVLLLSLIVRGFASRSGRGRLLSMAREYRSALTGR